MSEAGGGDPEQTTASMATSPQDAPSRRETMRAAVIPLRTQTNAASSSSQQAYAGPVTFNQAELRLIFGIYGRKVAAGEWRDYAMDFLRDQAIFSIYRRSSEVPLYRIEKTPRLARRQGEYAAIAASGFILKRGGDLGRVLAALDKPLKIVR
ncbi:DUF2794 domain-containing protein [Pseudochelatococcus contaminans]|uniref:DUF2794 domain-containing protein n=1 Tax=Pseudochelatococcus contaminans TaxID=1538103 RepID=A0A7W5Z2R1_9HYPH|nr:DUF2794 domain-containing protein [Pseudochelatococcus contaminans]MBB3809035.1 hypothetical protein [Pseudochelatococcus contaminans]